MVVAMTVVTLLTFMQRLKKGQGSAASEVEGLLRFRCLDGAREGRIGNTGPRLALHLRSSRPGRREITGQVQLFDGFQIGKRLDTVTSINLQVMQVFQLCFQILNQPTDRVGPAVNHAILDAGADGICEQTGGLAIFMDSIAGFLANV
jgi:hypothetical protein